MAAILSRGTFLRTNPNGRANVLELHVRPFCTIYQIVVYMVQKEARAWPTRTPWPAENAKQNPSQTLNLKGRRYKLTIKSTHLPSNNHCWVPIMKFKSSHCICGSNPYTDHMCVQHVLCGVVSSHKHAPVNMAPLYTDTQSYPDGC